MNKVQKTKLGDLIEFQRGYDLPKSSFVNGKYPVISSNGVLGYHNAYKVKGPGITIGRSGTVGLPQYIKSDYFPHNTALFIKNFKGNFPRYIYYLLKTFSLNNRKTGSGVPTMNRNHLHPLIVSAYLDLKDQKNIASVLSSLDSKIELNNKINAELEQMAKALYDYWFVQFDFPDINGKPYKSSGGKMIWSKELKREIPERWEVKTLNKAVNIFDSKRIPLSNMQREKMKGQYPYYGATSIMDYVNDYIFDGEYILLAEDGSVIDEKGLPIVQFIWGRTWVNNHAHVLQPKVAANSEYLFHFLKTISVVQIMTGSIQKKINQENLMSVNLAFPDKNTLESFSKFTIPTRKKLTNLIEENKKLTELRDWLLPILMNGQVKVKIMDKDYGN